MVHEKTTEQFLGEMILSTANRINADIKVDVSSPFGLHVYTANYFEGGHGSICAAHSESDARFGVISEVFRKRFDYLRRMSNSHEAKHKWWGIDIADEEKRHCEEFAMDGWAKVNKE